MKIIITEGYYSAHCCLGILIVSEKSAKKAIKIIKKFVEEIEKEIPNNNELDEYFQKKAQYERQIIRKYAGDIKYEYPHKLQILRAILEKNNINYCFEDADELNLGDYW